MECKNENKLFKRIASLAIRRLLPQESQILLKLRARSRQPRACLRGLQIGFRRRRRWQAGLKRGGHRSLQTRLHIKAMVNLQARIPQFKRLKLHQRLRLGLHAAQRPNDACPGLSLSLFRKRWASKLIFIKKKFTIISIFFADWRWKPSALEDDHRHRMIVRWFADQPKSGSPFSIHSLVSLGVPSGKRAGDWYGPASTAHIISRAVKSAAAEHPQLRNLTVYVAQDCASKFHFFYLEIFFYLTN